jgi:hypothetical protein
VDSATLDHDNSHSARASVQRHVLFGGTVESGTSLRDGQSVIRSPPTQPTYGWVSDDSLQPAASTPQALPARPVAMRPSAGSRQLLEGLLVELVPSSLGLVAYATTRLLLMRRTSRLCVMWDHGRSA